MALQHSDLPKAGIMAEQHDYRIDRSYTVGRIEWMLENYHALLSRKPMSLEDKAQMSSVVTSDSQWWNAQAYWRKVDRKADLDKAIAWVARGDYRRRMIIDLRYRHDPHDKLTWDEIAAALALERTQVWRIHRYTVSEIAWFLGGKSD